MGVREMVIGVMAGNAAARLYEWHGFRPWAIKHLGTIPDES